MLNLDDLKGLRSNMMQMRKPDATFKSGQRAEVSVVAMVMPSRHVPPSEPLAGRLINANYPPSQSVCQ